MGKILLFISIIFLTFSCSKTEDLKKEKPKKEVKKVVKPKYRSLVEFDYEGRNIEYKEISIKIPLLFSEKENLSFFMDDGINLTFEHDQINGTVEDYILEVYSKLKKDYVKIIKDIEVVLVNNKEVTLVKYVLDRKKYFIEIYSVIVQKDKDIYIVNISGKKKDMIKNNQLLMGIFSSIKIKK